MEGNDSNIWDFC